MSDALLLAVSVWALYFSWRHWRELQRSRDYATELSQLIHDYDLTRDDLRRSLNWDEIEDRVEKQEDD